MANQEHLDILKQGVIVWNEWRKDHPETQADLSKTNLSRANLSGTDLRGADFRSTDLSGADLSEADLRGADFGFTNLNGANLSGANLSGAHLFFSEGINSLNASRANLSELNLRGLSLDELVTTGANFSNTDLTEANLSGKNLEGINFSGAIFRKANLLGTNLAKANLTGADLREAEFSRESVSELAIEDLDLEDRVAFEESATPANLSEANLTEADLSGVSLNNINLSGADLIRADLSGADLTRALLIETDMRGSTMTNCRIYGIAAWDVNLEGAKQEDLIITPPGQPTITVDNLKVAQFIYLLLNNQEIREVIDTIAKKAVLILGRFSPERKTVLDALRDELRKQNYSPIVFDFEKPGSRNFTETVRTLAHLSRFIIADLTDPSSIPQELQAIIPTLAVPVQPVLLEGKREYAIFVDLLSTYHWVLPIFYYTDQASLLGALKEHVIGPAEQKAQELAKR